VAENVRNLSLRQSQPHLTVHSMQRLIAFVCFDAHQPLDLVGPHEAFAIANMLHRPAQAARPYRLIVASSHGQQVQSESGLVLGVNASLSQLARHRIDTLIVCGGRGARQQASHDPHALKQLRRCAQNARRIASICTGAFVLAAAGLLDAKRATTHWSRCAQLAERFPQVRVETAPIYVRDGNTWTSAGITAGIDLALALVEDDYGRRLASEVARHLVVFVRRAGGQAQFSEQLSIQAAERAPLRELMNWVSDHPNAELDVPALAKRAHMSLRNFARTFRAETGTTPAAYVERIRVETARRLLKTSQQSIADVAATAGFGTPEALRRAFARRLSLSPREYRARFGEH